MNPLALLLAAAALVSGAPVIASGNDSGKQVVVVAAKAKDLEEDHYLWAAELVASRLEGEFKVVPGGLAGGLRFSREQPGEVAGILEIVIDVYTAFEEVRITCFDTSGRERWKRKTELNAGGSEEKLARNMLDRVIKKVEEKKLSCE